MSRPPKHGFAFTPTDRPEQRYNPTDDFRGAPTSATAGPSPSHLNETGLWFQSEQPESGFGQNLMAFNHNVMTPLTITESMASVKHRRTRSGCFTCRQRRVKCDEKRPTCDRCRKGNRQCDFPQSSSSARRPSKDETPGVPLEQPSPSYADEAGGDLDTIEDESTEDTTPTTRKQRFSLNRDPPAGSGFEPELNPGYGSPDDQESSTPMRQRSSPEDTSRWGHLEPQMQKYLQFQRDHMNHHHYFLHLDPTDFLHHEFIALALSFEPLLNAVVGFAAYHYAIRQQDGRFRDFWQYYSRSIVLLRKWLEKNTEQNEAILLTILQLAVFEEYLGDWANSSGHERAAHDIFTSIYNYESFLIEETSRCIFQWMGRIALLTGLIAGTEVELNRAWFKAARNWYHTQFLQDKIDLSNAIFYFYAALRVVGFDMAKNFANVNSFADSTAESTRLSYRLREIRTEIEAFCEDSYNSTDVHHGDDMSQEHSIFARSSKFPPLEDKRWPLNHVWITWYGFEQMHTYQTILLLRAEDAALKSASSPATHISVDELPPELERLSSIMYQIFESAHRLASAPVGAILTCHNVMALASIFLKRETRYTIQARRTLAMIERMGYIWPLVLRRKMAQLWSIDEVVNWWLPNREGSFPLLDEIRGVAEERDREIVESGVDDGRSNLRKMRAIFGQLDIGP